MAKTKKALAKKVAAKKPVGKKLAAKEPVAKKVAAKKAAPAVKKSVAPLEKPKGFAPRPANTRWPQEIKIGKRHRKDFGALDELARSISERGDLIQAIAIDAENNLIAGERRLRAWPLTTFRDRPIPVNVISIDSIIAGEWDENAQRKDFTPSEAVAIQKEMEKLLKKLAEERQKGGRKVEGPTGRAADQAAKFTGKARRTIDKAKEVVEAAEKNPERFGKLKDDMDRTGKVDGPFKRLQIMQQTDALKNSPAPLPMMGPYETGVIDFPWPGEKDADQESIDKRGRAMRGYPEMSIESGKKLFRSKEFQALLAKNCTIYFWTTNHHMREAYELLDAMGMEKQPTIGTWGKNKMGRGQVLRGRTEHCIVATRGKPLVNLTNQTTLWQGEGWDVREDSRKPDAFFDMVEELTPAKRYFEVFSRGGRNDKWDCHGDQAGKFAPSIAKEAQDAILAEVKKSPDEQKLMVLEAVSRGEAPDMRLLDKKLFKDLERYVEGTKKLKLTQTGERVFEDLREQVALRAYMRGLPEGEALAAEYLAVIDELDAAMLGGEQGKIEIAENKVDAIASKCFGKADGPFGWRVWSEVFARLCASVAAPVGAVPKWGQAGLFPMDVDGLRCIVQADFSKSNDFMIYASDPERPFFERDGLWKEPWHVELEWETVAHGKTVAQYIQQWIRDELENVARSIKKNGGDGGMSLPDKIYELPKEWNGRSELKGVAVRRKPGASEKETPAAKKSGPAKLQKVAKPKKPTPLEVAIAATPPAAANDDGAAQESAA